MSLSTKLSHYLFYWISLLISVEAAVRLQQQQQQQEPHFDDNPYWHRELLDPGGKYQLEWLVDWSRGRVEFNVTVETNGYVALGLSRNTGKMEGADIVIGGVVPNGSVYFSDFHAIGNQEPVEDPRQDWELYSAWESETHTFLSFSRPFDTCDEQDIPINDDAVYVLWAYGESDVLAYHAANRGSYLTYLRDPDLTPRSIHEANQNASVPVVERIGDAVRWSLRAQIRIPPKRTTYWCTIHKFSPISPGKKHIIGYNVRINQEAIQHMHHMLVYRCIIPPNYSPVFIYEPQVGHPGQECYLFSDRMGPIITQLCYQMKMGFAIGGTPTFLPPQVGIPIGETGPNEYYLWQVHYDNPELRSDIDSDIQLDAYYTSNLREKDGGILSLGQHIPGSPSILLPPGEVDHRIYGHCSSSCTTKMLPRRGIKLNAGLLHTHETGRRVRIQHYRNGKELPWILNDDNFKFTYQPIRLLRNEITVLPGDQVSVQCYHDTTLRNSTTVGGYGTHQEMCKTFLLYHTVLEKYIFCRSEITSLDYMMKFLGGTNNVTWDQPTLEQRAMQPPHLAGLTLSAISDSQFVNWDNDLRTQLRNDHISYPQEAVCPNLKELVLMGLLGVKRPPHYVSFPMKAIEYVPSQSCPVGISPVNNTFLG